MRKELLDVLACPDCGSAPLGAKREQRRGNEIEAGELFCAGCRASFPIVDGIPVLLPRDLAGSGNLGDKPSPGTKGRQMAFFDEEGATELEIERPHGCGRVYNFMLRYKLETVLRLYGRPIAGKHLLCACCGSGMDAEFLSRAGARVVGLDLSLGAARGARIRAQRYGLDYELVVGDSEKMPFRSAAFEVSFVHDGLHHLDAPFQGVAELVRVAREGVLLTEPANARLTRLAVHLGIAADVEEAGNIVRRLDPEELLLDLDRLGLGAVRYERYLMYYQQKPLKVFRWFEPDWAFALFRLGFWFGNVLLGRWGNKLACVGSKRVAAAERTNL